MKKILISALLLSIYGITNAADLKAGEEKVNTICMACHGQNGHSTNPEWPNLAGQGEKYLIKQLNDFKSGARKNAIMAPQATILNDDDIKNIAAFLASQKPSPAATQGVGTEPEKMLALGEALYRGGDLERNIPACAACHGPNGAGIAPAAFPLLSGQHAAYNRLQLQHFQNAANADIQASDSPIPEDQQRSNDPNQMMQDIAKALTPQQIEAVTLYIQGLH